MEDLRVFSYVLISVLYGISTTTILMRVYVRGLTMRSFWWDDWLMTAMLVSFSGYEVGMSLEALGSNLCAVFQHCPTSNLLLFISPWSGLVSRDPDEQSKQPTVRQN